MVTLEQVKKFIFDYQPEGIIVDTNVLILFLIGTYDTNFIRKFKRTNIYSVDDFKLLKEILAYFKKYIITPQILAELSNLSVTADNIYGDKLIEYLRVIIRFIESTEERYQKRDCLCGMELSVVGRYGFTDMTMFELSRQTKMPIITDDSKLYMYLYKRTPIINFECMRNQL